MEEKFKNLKELIEYSNGGILSKVIEKSDKSDITLFCMAKGTEISEHTSVKEGFIYVIEGRGIFNLSGKDIEIQEGLFIKLAKNIVHSLKTEENMSFLLFLVS